MSSINEHKTTTITKKIISKVLSVPKQPKNLASKPPRGETKLKRGSKRTVIKRP